MTFASFIVAMILGLVLLILGAVRFIDSASHIAANLGLSPLVIGLTIVAFGTSLPEILISALSAFDGAPDLGMGNAIGSNIANIGLVLGLTTLIMPITVQKDTLKREFPLLALATIIALFLMLDKHLGRLDGIILFACFILTLAGMAYLTLRGRQHDNVQDDINQQADDVKVTTKQASISFMIGLIALLVGSKAMVWGAIGIAELLDISKVVIGLTIVAIGTSLPELSASLVSAFKRQHDIAVGNILGSNIFNILAVLAMPGLIHPSYLDTWLLSRDFLVMAALFILLYVFTLTGRQGHVGRFAGFIMLAVYSVYMITLGLTKTIGLMT